MWQLEGVLLAHGNEGDRMGKAPRQRPLRAEYHAQGSGVKVEMCSDEACETRFFVLVDE